MELARRLVALALFTALSTTLDFAKLFTMQMDIVNALAGIVNIRPGRYFSRVSPRNCRRRRRPGRPATMRRPLDGLIRWSETADYVAPSTGCLYIADHTAPGVEPINALSVLPEVGAK